MSGNSIRLNVSKRQLNLLLRMSRGTLTFDELADPEKELVYKAPAELRNEVTTPIQRARFRVRLEAKKALNKQKTGDIYAKEDRTEPV